MMVPAALVGVENTAYHFDMAYTYVIPPEMQGNCLPGCRVMVSFGLSKKGRRQGIVLEITETEENSKLKPVLAVLDKAPLLNCEMLGLVRRLKETTFCTYFEAARVMFPTGINLKIQTSYAASPEVTDDGGLNEQERRVFSYLKDKKKFVEKEKLYAALGMDKNSDIAEVLYESGLLLKDYGAGGAVSDAA
ncbi:MAG: primosomal protein N', partial [Clostridia bacterium]|nr:primosomal protein N' [Clostridia bacterium]